MRIIYIYIYIYADSGPNNIAARSQGVYRLVTNDRSQFAMLLPALFNVFRARQSRVVNNAWAHFGFTFESRDIFRIYQDGVLYIEISDPRYSSVIDESSRFSITIEGAYFDGSILIKPPNYKQMNCFALLRPFNYTKLYDEMTNFQLYS
ncbi:unnamed protein product [Rotaria magnacalcarata]|uniref:Uncharacterized protein n=1 Tax=Rotaria magnacalcarata TaxID=392030 RepID=A0A816V351_9BILA|nr:unnamed protein product [Rotaria magnacalcarata]CAF4126941.1 unnamed protein product [Rotaria magnacalcarata]